MAGLDEIKILIVDDNSQMRTLIRSALRGAGVTAVFEAANVFEGLDILSRQAADLILLDLAMKPLDGIEFAARVRQPDQSPNPFVPIIMMTCHAQRARVAAARDAGVNSFLAKPISGRSLIEHVFAVINDARPFVRCDTYFGPDRRRGAANGRTGPRRRAGECGDNDGFDIEDLAPSRQEARAS